MKPFLHLATRDLDEAAADELEAIRLSSGLDAADLVQLRVDAGPLPDFDPDDFSGAFIGGSAFNASDAVKSELQLRAERDLGRVAELGASGRLPVLGLCYGIGVLVRHFGGRLDSLHAEPTSAVELALTEDGRADPIFGALPDRFLACTGHKESCAEPPAGAAVLLAGEACPIQAIRVGEAAYATQFHPELDPERTVRRMSLYRETGYFPAAEYEAVARRVRTSGVGEWPGRIVRGFAERFAR